MFTPEKLINILIHVICISTFLNIFFFTYGSYIEKKVVKAQVKYIVDSLFYDIKKLIPLKKKYLPKFELPKNLKDADENAKNENNKLLSIAIKYTILFVLICICIICCIVYLYNINSDTIIELVNENFIILGFFALTEFIFSTYFAQYYRSADPNFIKYTILSNI